jgi:hypothetical protein
VTQQIALSAVLGAAVQAAGSRVGVVSDVYADSAAEYVVGLEVVGPNDRRWFLPWVAATFAEGMLHAASPLVFMPAEQLDFYVEHGARLAEGSSNGVLVDADGRLTRPSTGAAVSGLRGEGTAES